MLVVQKCKYCYQKQISKLNVANCNLNLKNKKTSVVNNIRGKIRKYHMQIQFSQDYQH